MNTKTKLGIGMLFVIMACMIVLPASAQENVIVLSELSPSFSMSMTPGNLLFPLTTVGTNEKLDGNAITVNTNGQFKIEAKSDKTGGKMERFSGTLTSVFLTNPLQIAINDGAYYPLTTVDQQIHATFPAGSWTSPIKLKQITVFADPPAQAPANYQCTLTITGGNV